MEVTNYPFGNGVFNSTTSVLLDACFLLSLIDATDSKFDSCNKVMQQILNSKSQVYVTNVVSAEVLNVLMVKLFKLDMMSSIDNNQTQNAKGSIQQFLKYFKPADKKKICKKNNSADNINYKYIFNKVYKSPDRNLLNVYFQEAIKIQTAMEKVFNIRYISMNKDYFIQCRDFMAKHLLMVNDASHLAVAENRGLTYLLSLDSDFVNVNDVKTKLLRI
jgi:predicted nucleic acid-binding protein